MPIRGSGELRRAEEADDKLTECFLPRVKSRR